MLGLGPPNHTDLHQFADVAADLTRVRAPRRQPDLGSRLDGHQCSTIRRFAMITPSRIRMLLTTTALGALIGVMPVDDALGQAARTSP
jgi:hypothetical protein